MAFDVDVRKVVILSEGWKSGSSGSYVAAITVKTTTPTTNKEKPMFPIKLTAFCPKFSGRKPAVLENADRPDMVRCRSTDPGSNRERREYIV